MIEPLAIMTKVFQLTPKSLHLSVVVSVLLSENVPEVESSPLCGILFFLKLNQNILSDTLTLTDRPQTCPDITSDCIALSLANCSLYIHFTAFSQQLTNTVRYYQCHQPFTALQSGIQVNKTDRESFQNVCHPDLFPQILIMIQVNQLYPHFLFLQLLALSYTVYSIQFKEFPNQCVIISVL